MERYREYQGTLQWAEILEENRIIRTENRSKKIRKSIKTALYVLLVLAAITVVAIDIYAVCNADYKRNELGIIY